MNEIPDGSNWSRLDWIQLDWIRVESIEIGVVVSVRRGLSPIRGRNAHRISVRVCGVPTSLLVPRIPVFPVGTADRTRLLVGIEPGCDAL